MRKIIFISLMIFSSTMLKSQVGVNTETPQATMHVTPTKTDNSTPEGIIAPNLTRAQLIDKDAQYTSTQRGAVVYVTSITGTTTTKTANVTSIGYYYFDGSLWQPFYKNMPTTEPWYVQGSTTQATSNTQNIFQSGNVAIGSNTSSSYKFQVTGTSNITGNARVGGNSTIVGNEYVTGNVGVGTTSPTTKVHINTATNGNGFRLVDGTQADGRVLTSDANGNARWRESGIQTVNAVWNNDPTFRVSSDRTADYLSTGSTLTLPPGRWLVNTSLLFGIVGGIYSPCTYWIRTSFTDGKMTAGSTATITTDYESRNNLMSGYLLKDTRFALVSGSMVLNNTTTANKTYTLIAGNFLTQTTPIIVSDFWRLGQGIHLEDNITAIKIQD
ncbi:hypothetical protein [Dysgonomonas sp. 520]|uniref:hypothetical protein n=1 Tax=Dysgonomonas sp. 520 TaxID=2302931 RepID=UPI0013D59024|nr:hypothetical protein [Dysgonomonas sp. 520]NDW09607.1 hypothetical protein [Dysgonomonas sp. 520]